MKQTFYVRFERNEDDSAHWELSDSSTVESCENVLSLADDNFHIIIGTNSAPLDKFDMFYVGLLIGQNIEIAQKRDIDA